ncbi:MAG: hypothetical protein HQK49_15530 [Oligoflexia bacterium]|nr:hypothetical protein [Oligoflexia bacterium]
MKKWIYILIATLTTFTIATANSNTNPNPNHNSNSNSCTNSNLNPNSNLDNYKFGLWLAADATTQRKYDYNVDVSDIRADFYPMLNLNNNYYLNSSFWLYPQFRMERNLSSEGRREYSVKANYWAFRFDQNKILTKEKHGVNFDLSTRYYSRITAESRNRYLERGFLQFRTYLTTKEIIANKFYLWNEARLSFVNTDSEYTQNNPKAIYYHEIYFTPKFKINDKLTALIEAWNYHSQGRDTSHLDTSDETDISPGIDYQLGDKLELMGKIGTVAMISHATRESNLYYDFVAIYTPNPKLSTILNITFSNSSNNNAWDRPRAEVDLGPTINNKGNWSRHTVKDRFKAEVDFVFVAF